MTSEMMAIILFNLDPAIRCRYKEARAATHRYDGSFCVLLRKLSLSSS